MKTITFSASPVDSNKDMQALRSKCVQFLKKHGWCYANEPDRLAIDKYKIVINPNCANSSFTKALSLFQLIFSDAFGDGNKGAYIAYRPEGIILSLNGKDDPEMVIDWINKHMEITIS